MTLMPLDLMLSRVSRNSSDSDFVLFTELLYAGEFILKMTTAAFLSGIENDRENHRYRLVHGLVRADSVGEWPRALDEVLTGPPTQQLASALTDARRAFTERLGNDSWQYEAVRDLHEVLEGVCAGAQRLGDKVALRAWFPMFAELRNKTRGHGAITPATSAKLVPKLKNSILLICENNPILALPWAYLHRNLSGKYRVIALGGDETVFKKLTSASAANGENYQNGVYLWAGKYRRVELVHTDLNVSDFFLPNGNFRNGTYELHSLITDSRLKGDASPFMAAASERPPSETEGKGTLDVLDSVFTNLPAPTASYVRRPQLEGEVRAAIENDRHPIVTLVGRGGIGKTSLVLEVLREIAKTDRYNVIVWFSARDIDLMSHGAKPVQPHVLTDREIAEEYRALLGRSSEGAEGKTSDATFMAEHLRKSPLGPTLFVFDNFETVRSPIDLFQWIDTNIRLPNKAVITSRFREFKADYPIEVLGMEQDEAERLVTQTTGLLGIKHLIGKNERDLILEESDGHPYVIKIILGEVANAGKFSKPSRIIARKEDILDALFDRTYTNLSPMAVHVFLMLSRWRSMVPQLAVEAVLLRHSGGDENPGAAIDQLARMSLVERTSASDGTDFLNVPLAAALFGRRKLEVSPNRAVIESDIEFLQDIGASDASGLKAGIRPRVETFFKKAVRRISGGGLSLEEMRPVFEFLARGYPPAWILLSELEEEIGGRSGIDRAAACVRRYLETHPLAAEGATAWRRLLRLYRAVDDVFGACGAFLNAAEVAEPPLDDISDMANWLNNAPEAKAGVDVNDRSLLFKPLAGLLELYIAEASGTDLSRLAWLHLHSGDAIRALDVARIGLKREPDNIYCQRLVQKLTDAS